MHVFPNPVTYMTILNDFTSHKSISLIVQMILTSSDKLFNTLQRCDHTAYVNSLYRAYGVTS